MYIFSAQNTAHYQITSGPDFTVQKSLPDTAWTVYAKLILPRDDAFTNSDSDDTKNYETRRNPVSLNEKSYELEPMYII